MILNRFIFFISPYLLLFNCTKERVKAPEIRMEPEHSIKINLEEPRYSNPVAADSSSNWLDVKIGITYRADLDGKYLFILNNSPNYFEFSVYDISTNTSIWSIENESIDDFSVNKIDKRVYLLLKNKIIQVYSFEGDKLSQVKLSGRVSEIRYLSKNIILGYNNYINNSKSNYKFFNINTGNRIKEYLAYDRSARGLAWSVNSSLTRNNADTVFGTTFFSNKVYKISETSFSNWLELDFGDANPVFEELLAQETNISPFKLAFQKNWVYTIDNMIESQDLLICEIIKGGRAIYIVVDKRNPTNWFLSTHYNYVASIGNTFVGILKDKESVTMEDRVVLTNRVKLLYYNHL